MNAHQVLNLLPGSSAAVIKRAYRKLAQKYHPDRNKEVGAEKKFVLIKEAYEFLLSGKSNSGVFDDKPVLKPKPTPKTKPAPAPVWQTGYGATNVEKVQLLVSFSDAFTGAKIRIPNTPFIIFVRAGVQNGYKERRLCQSQQGIEAYFDIEYRLYDPGGFYKLQDVDGAGVRVCCHLEMTSGQLLSGFEHTLKNINPLAGPVIISVPVNHGRYLRIPNAGIRLDEAGHRSDLYVIPVVTMTPIEQEIQPVLVAMSKRVQDSLKEYRYFK